MSDKKSGYFLFQTVILMILEWFEIQWSNEHLTECAEILYDEYYWMQIGELKHFVLKVKSGHYDRSILKNKINAVTLIDWMGQYGEESLKIRQTNYVNGAMSDKSDERADKRIAEWNKEETDFTMRAQMEDIKRNLKPNSDAEA